MLAQGLNRNAATRPGANVIQGLRPGLPQLATDNDVMTGSGGSPRLHQLLTSMMSKSGGIPLTQDQLGGPSVANTTNWTRGPAAPTTTIPGATAIGDPYQPGIGPLTSIPGAPTTSIPAPAQAGNIGQRFTDAYGNPAGGQPNDTVLQQLLARLREQSGGRGNTYNGGGTGSTRMSDSRLPAQGNNGMPAVAPMETRIPAPGAGRTGSGGGLGDMLSRLQRR